MPPLTTKTVRITEAQENKLRSDIKGRSSFLFRELLKIFFFAQLPGIEIIKLRHRIALPDEEFKKVD